MFALLGTFTTAAMADDWQDCTSRVADRVLAHV